jgi:TetR/AcrR family transcriptional regulator, fatty acid metabolism regulator protein
MNLGSPTMARPPTRSKRTANPDGERVSKRKALRETASEVYRNAILVAAEDQFTRQGFGAAKMSEIAAAAGLGTGTVYNYFDSKERIFDSLVELRASQLMERLGLVVASDRPGADKLGALLGEHLAFVEQHRGMFMVFNEVGHPSANHVKNIAGFLKIYEDVLGAMAAEKVLRHDCPVRDLVAFFMGTLNGFMRMWILRGEPDGLASRSPAILDLLMRGMGSTR